MGGGIALLMAEKAGLHVSLQDPSEEAMDAVVKEAEEKGFGDRVKKTKSMSKRSTLECF